MPTSTMMTFFKTESELENQIVELIKKNRNGKTTREIAVELDIPISKVDSAVDSLVEQKILSIKGIGWANKPVYGLHLFM